MQTEPGTVTLFLCGDVMTGRGIDQILPYPGKPDLFESEVHSALTYVDLAERANGPIPRPVRFAYIWGDALEELERVQPHARVINLETSITRSDARWRDKPVLYRMSPENTPSLTAAGINCCVLANNHVLDFGRPGLAQTLEALHGAGICTAGAGRDPDEAAAPAVVATHGATRVCVFGIGVASSGIPGPWRATRERSGIQWIADESTHRVEAIARGIAAHCTQTDIVVGSIHWGGNWGFEISERERALARWLIDEAGVDVVHGHSSHHVKGIEVYRGKVILYGCGDLLNDYEGIGGYEAYRGDLGLMYFLTLDPRGALVRLVMVATQIRRLRISRAPPTGVEWLLRTMRRECAPLGTGVRQEPDGRLALQWDL